MKFEFKILDNKADWNEFFNDFPTLPTGIPVTTFTQSFTWGDFQEALGKKVYRIGIYDSEKLVGVALGVFIDAKRGKYLYFRNGPLIDWSNKTLVTETIDYLKNLAKENGAWFIRVSPLIEKESVEANNIDSLDGIDCPMNDVEALDTWIMPLEDNDEANLSSIKKKTRYLIRKAQEEEMKLEPLVTSNTEVINDFYQILQDTVKRQNWNSYSKDYIQKEFNSFAADNNVTAILIKYYDTEKQMTVYVAGGVFIHTNNQTFYHYGASVSEYSRLPGSYLMIWEAIKEATKRGHKFFNFWGISPENRPNHPWAGLTSFKMKFPGIEQRWNTSKDFPVSSKYWLTNLYERFDKYRKGY